MEYTDWTCLAEGIAFPASFEKTGLNQNEIIVGPTGCGKSVSNGQSRLLYTSSSSVVVPIAKKAIKEKFTDMFKERGYRVMSLDFAHPENCSVGYDPLDFIHSDQDVVQTARNLIGIEASRGRTGDADPYWNDSATSVLAAEIGLVRLNAASAKKKPCFADVIEMHRSLKINVKENLVKTNLDSQFDKSEFWHPGNQAAQMWRTVRDLSPRTASCIFSIVNNAIDKIFSDNVLAVTRQKKRIDFKELGRRKIALFITTSPMNRSLQSFINLLYADMFRELFEEAESHEDGRMDVPVHIICDDFACGGRILNFDDYISIFRAAGISVTLLLQSESQLVNMYGESAATTIINNCDTYVYMGGMDITTCRNISLRMNKPLDKVMQMPLEQVVVFRRGYQPMVARRYQTLSDPVYLQLLEKEAQKKAANKEANKETYREANKGEGVKGYGRD
ncbi:MAG: type IV secretory system conjugative DNA transfer family protein [Lachnospiraceae bacterium]|nr:type IV secretory system conjugative DNA transfer family protein [Lachnospiraceae bacterium]